LEIARGHVYYALCALQGSFADLALASDAAYASATRAYAAAARTCIHVHGAQGFTWANDAHLHYRRARALAAALGAERACRERIANALFAGVRPDL
jgi:alkylation response protein AidB-like acyl-CoA dehydrogenase